MFQHYMQHLRNMSDDIIYIYVHLSHEHISIKFKDKYWLNLYFPHSVGKSIERQGRVFCWLSLCMQWCHHRKKNLNPFKRQYGLNAHWLLIVRLIEIFTIMHWQYAANTFSSTHIFHPWLPGTVKREESWMKSHCTNIMYIFHVCKLIYFNGYSWDWIFCIIPLAIDFNY